jgi:DNA replication protein DnaC
MKTAKLRGPACVDDIDYRAARGPDKTVMRALAKDSAWVRNHENVFVIGPCGVGKSFIALGSGTESLSRRPLGPLSAGGRLAA